jgi:hypothetical protein
MTPVIDFVNVSTTGLESTTFPEALAGLRAHEARYFKNKYDHDFTVKPATSAKRVLQWVEKILRDERGITITSPAVEVSQFQVDNIKWTYVFYQSGLSINVLWELDGPKPKRAVGFKLIEAMDIPGELTAFKFARQKSALAGTIRGTYFLIKGDY